MQRCHRSKDLEVPSSFVWTGSNEDVFFSDMGKGSIPEKKKSKTPRLTKRMAARLDGKASDTDTSRSNADRYVICVL